MAQSLSKILLHLVFTTKYRHPWITDDVSEGLHALIATTCRSLGSEAYRVGGTEDHVHVACTLPRTLTVSKLLEELKSHSSGWIKQQSPACEDFAWQAGYGAFSLGQSKLSALIRYIDNQREHHAFLSCQEEVVALLDHYGVEYDIRFLWD